MRSWNYYFELTFGNTLQILQQSVSEYLTQERQIQVATHIAMNTANMVLDSEGMPPLEQDAATQTTQGSNHATSAATQNNPDCAPQVQAVGNEAGAVIVISDDDDGNADQAMAAVAMPPERSLGFLFQQRTRGFPPYRGRGRGHGSDSAY